MAPVQRDRGEAAEAAAHHEARARRERAHGLGDGRGEFAGFVPPVASPVRTSVAGKVDGYRRAARGQGRRVPGAGALAAVVEEHDLRRSRAPEHSADVPSGGHVDPATAGPWQRGAGNARSRRCLVDKSELVAEFGECLGHGSHRGAPPARVSCWIRVNRILPVSCSGHASTVTSGLLYVNNIGQFYR